MTADSIEQNIAKLRARIAAAARRGGRDPEDITLLAASKSHPASAIRAAHSAGLRHIGENYLQEALAKQAELRDLPLCWHFLGPVQSNKARAIAERFDWLHSLSRPGVASRLSERRPRGREPLQVCLQVNISREESKSGVAPAELPLLAERVAGLAGLRLRGLMAIPRATASRALQRRAFARLRRLFVALRRRHPQLDTLSMGMSADLEAAVAEGATLVRIGSGLFGPR